MDTSSIEIVSDVHCGISSRELVLEMFHFSRHLLLHVHGVECLFILFLKVWVGGLKDWTWSGDRF